MSVARIPGQRVSDNLISTGVAGLDNVLGGGLTPGRLYLIEGTPGAGKTTIALQFLIEGAARGESVLYVTLSETESEMRGVASSHGWSLERIHVREMLPSQESLQPEEQYTMFHPSEVELSETTHKILLDVDKLKPTRVVFDSLSELRLLAGNSLRYRRQILALKQFFAGRECTVLMLDDMTSMHHDLQVQSIAHAVLRLEQLNSDYGAARRRLMVVKYRGRDFRGGFHDYKIIRGGLVVYPRLVAAEHGADESRQKLASGIAALDELLGGGLEQGTSTLFVGAPGTGKSSVAVQFALAAANRGECAALFIFDESIKTLLARCSGIARRTRPRHPPRGDAEQGQGRHHRQPQRLPQRDAERAVPDHPAARTADVSRPGGRRHAADRRAAWLDRHADEDAGRRQLSGRRSRHPALLRGRRHGAPGHLGAEEARRRA
jgi:circadian clock protein KaiC